MRVTREMLWAYVADSLDPAEAADVARWIAASPERAIQVEAIRRAAPPPRPCPPVLRAPPPNYGLPASVGNGDRLSTTAPIRGWFRVTAAPVTDAALREVFLLRRQADGWIRVEPDLVERRIPLTTVARDEEGNHLFDLRARGPLGEQRLMIALPLSAEVDGVGWPPDGWLRDQIHRGGLPVVSVTVDIVAN